jgi:hypothetical protein
MQVQEKTVFDDEAEVRRERAARRAVEDAERLKGAASLQFSVVVLTSDCGIVQTSGVAPGHIQELGSTHSF